jgi:acetamidase/formamidase
MMFLKGSKKLNITAKKIGEISIIFYNVSANHTVQTKLKKNKNSMYSIPFLQPQQKFLDRQSSSWKSYHYSLKER